MSYFGAHEGADRANQERNRALQRIVVCFSILAVWGIQFLFRWHVQPQLWFIVLAGVINPIVAIFYWRHLRSHPAAGISLQYAWLVLDPLMIMILLVQDPKTFAFLNPFLLVVVVRSGIRYGIRTMYLSWVATLLAAGLLATSPFWRENLELTFAFLLILAFVPVFFATLIRRIHKVRAIEAERARAAAMHELATARSVFLAKVSHELRSPLQSIVSALDVIEMRHSSAFEGDGELIARMRRSSLLLNTQLRDLMTLAKGEAGRLELRPQAFDAVALLEGLADGVRESAHGKGLRLVVIAPTEPIFVVADGARVDQVLSNLLVNSIRYTDQGTVSVALREFDPPSHQLQFTIADTGPGIPEALLPNLFAPDKLVGHDARRGEGSGIGLAIVRILVDHLGAKISVDSTPGKGTTFTFDVPVEQVDQQTSADSPTTTTRRVLVVDDREDVLVGLVGVVDQLGYECDQASSAAAGADLLASRRYDVALLDIDMPGRGGAELAADTRAGNGPNRSSRLVGMSATDVSRGSSANFDYCILKPIDLAGLRKVLLDVGDGTSQPGLWPKRS